MYDDYTQYDYDMVAHEMAYLKEVGDLDGWISAKRDTQIMIAIGWAEQLINDEGSQGETSAYALLAWVEQNLNAETN